MLDDVGLCWFSSKILQVISWISLSVFKVPFLLVPQGLASPLQVVASMNEINKQKRLRDASQMAAEAEKIKATPVTPGWGGTGWDWEGGEGGLGESAKSVVWKIAGIGATTNDGWWLKNGKRMGKEWILD